MFAASQSFINATSQQPTSLALMSPHACFSNNQTTGACSTPPELQRDRSVVVDSPKSPATGSPMSNSDVSAASSASFTRLNLVVDLSSYIIIRFLLSLP